MNTRLISAAAIALSLVAGSASAQVAAPGADGPTFPSLSAGAGTAKTRADVKAELAQAQREQTIATDGEGGAWMNQDHAATTASTTSRAVVRAEAVRVGAIRSANTPY